MAGCSRVEAWLMPGSRFDKEPKTVAVLPVGSVERHGDHLPLGTDALEAVYVAEAVARRLCAHLYPPIWYGHARSLEDFPGTVSVGEEALLHYVEDVLLGLARQGYKLVAVINGHGGNSSILRVAARTAGLTTETAFMVIDWWREAGLEARRRLFSSPGHAGEDETSAMLHIAPDSVDMDAARDYEAPWIPRASIYSKKLVQLLYPNAVLGAPTRASAEKGREWLEAAADEIAGWIREALEKLGLEKP